MGVLPCFAVNRYPHPAGREPKRRVSGQRRRELIERAAERAFAERGYDAASLEEIAAEAGISKRVIYDHFASKQELHMALIERLTRELWIHVAGAVGAESFDSAEARVAAGIEAFFTWVEEHPHAWRMLFRDPPDDPESVDLNRRLQAQTTAMLAALLSSDPDSGDAIAAAEAHTVELTAEMMKSTLTGLASWWYEHRGTPRGDLVSAAMGYAWVGLGRIETGERWVDPRTDAAADG